METNNKELLEKEIEKEEIKKEEVKQEEIKKEEVEKEAVKKEESSLEDLKKEPELTNKSNGAPFFIILAIIVVLLIVAFGMIFFGSKEPMNQNRTEALSNDVNSNVTEPSNNDVNNNVTRPSNNDVNNNVTKPSNNDVNNNIIIPSNNNSEDDSISVPKNVASGDKVIEKAKELYNKVESGAKKADLIKILGTPDRTYLGNFTESLYWEIEKVGDLVATFSNDEEIIVRKTLSISSSTYANVALGQELNTTLEDLNISYSKVKEGMTLSEVKTALGNGYFESSEDFEFSEKTYTWYDKKENSLKVSFEDGKVSYVGSVLKTY